MPPNKMMRIMRRLTSLKRWVLVSKKVKTLQTQLKIEPKRLNTNSNQLKMMIRKMMMMMMVKVSLMRTMM